MILFLYLSLVKDEERGEKFTQQMRERERALSPSLSISLFEMGSLYKMHFKQENKVTESSSFLAVFLHQLRLALTLQHCAQQIKKKVPFFYFVFT